MNTYLLVDGAGLIINIIDWDGEKDFTPPEGITLAQFDGPASVGWMWDGTTATDPNPPPVPPISVTMRQARLALIQAGLYDQINAAVAASDATTQVWWSYSPTVERNNPIVAAMAVQLGLTSDQLDTLFKTALTL